MRVVHVAHQYKPAIGGSEQYIVNLSEALARRGHRVDVCTTRARDYHTWRSELPPFEQLEGVNIYRFPSLQRRGYTWRLLRFGYDRYWATRSRLYEPFIFVGNGPLSPRLFLNLLWRGRRYDLVHLNGVLYSHTAYAYLGAKLLGLPIVVTPHIHLSEPHLFDIGYYDAVLRGSDLLLAVTELEKRHLVTRGIAEEKIVVGGNGVGPEAFERLDARECRRRLGIPEEAFVLLFLSRKTGYKGLETVLRAFTSLRGKYEPLVFVAAGPETDDSRRLLQEYAGVPQFIPFGAVSDREKLELLNACDLFLLPSRAEAFGIVFLEAWAVKKPVIGARSGAIPAVISEEEDGLLIEPDDAAGLARQIERLINDPALRRQLGEKGCEKVRARYTVERIADIVEGAYVQLLHRTSGCKKVQK
jgi:glycosyltransferase involved in cell wall biosynthesis